ncbi:hypothetical protein HanOQP8_Chr10g0348571 [Helianthus annuus]|nr:hypothetical protein HanLR1_Chr10g0344481 [Helianthus annuus]KAJ0698793.1 hypothetical protein HanOQP8_Chr10g0348571 [Helianthus annuus]
MCSKLGLVSIMACDFFVNLGFISFISIRYYLMCLSLTIYLISLIKFVQRIIFELLHFQGDQASIVGGAINFVKELEQQLQTLEVQKRATINGYSTPPPPQPFGYFFSFPQYSIHRTSDDAGGSATTANNRLPAMADIEVTMVESQANIKILSKKRHSQLLKMVAGLQCLWFTVLHLNVTTVEEMVLYTASVKETFVGKVSNERFSDEIIFV